ncbi:hypothetical protein EYZ11_008231 [Aspergillus tanneri]|uniref:Uncharacterized protein n=1 Tax=Aspergillus tanneri TaxID=1220188 RepID=A0A4S3JGJ2_9EURO|nr:hypothetical protein EYZ11_008231 [Aspergillus tanneri]
MTTAMRKETHSMNPANPNVRDSQIDISEEEAEPGFCYARDVPKTKRVDRRDFSRDKAWDRAINRYRNMVHQAGTNSSKHHDGAADNSRSLYSVQQPLDPAPYRALGFRNGQKGDISHEEFNHSLMNKYEIL